MADNKDNKTTPEVEKIQLEPNEIMRLSVFETEKSFATVFLTNGPQGPMVKSFMGAAEHLDLICVPKLPPILGDGDLPIAVVVCPRRNSEDENEEEPKEASSPQED